MVVNQEIKSKFNRLFQVCTYCAAALDAPFPPPCVPAALLAVAQRDRLDTWASECHTGPLFYLERQIRDGSTKTCFIIINLQ